MRRSPTAGASVRALATAAALLLLIPAAASAAERAVLAELWSQDG